MSTSKEEKTIEIHEDDLIRIAGIEMKRKNNARKALIQYLDGMIKKKYSNHFVCWGGISLESIISGKASDVKKEIMHAMENYKPGGRYIFGSSHSIAVGTKYDNFMTMVEEFEKNREY